MSLPIAFHRAASAEFIEASAWYETKRLGLAREFMAEIDCCMQFTACSPTTNHSIILDFMRFPHDAKIKKLLLTESRVSTWLSPPKLRDPCDHEIPPRQQCDVVPHENKRCMENDWRRHAECPREQRRTGEGAQMPAIHNGRFQ